jgi:hypothetical protein
MGEGEGASSSGVLIGSGSRMIGSGGGAGRGARRFGAAFFTGFAAFAGFAATLRFGFAAFLATLRALPRFAAALRLPLAATLRPAFLVVFLFFALAMICLLFECQPTGLATRWRHPS